MRVRLLLKLYRILQKLRLEALRLLQGLVLQFLRRLQKVYVEEFVPDLRKCVDLAIKEGVISIPANSDLATMTEELTIIIKEIPLAQRKILYALSTLAKIITSQNKINMMDETNMGTMFGPCIYWKDYSLESMQDIHYMNYAFTYILLHITDFSDCMIE